MSQNETETKRTEKAGQLERRVMRDDKVWEASTGKPLVLGQKIKICEDNPYYQDHAGIEFYITAMSFKKDGRTINITIGETIDQQESDGWTVADILPVA